MATRVVDLDLDAPLPETLPLDGYRRAWVVGWRSGLPVGAAALEPPPAGDAIPGAALAAAVAEMPAAADLPPATAAPLPRVSVVICTRDRPGSLPVALEALCGQTRRDFELVVVDNAPRDSRTRRVVETLAPGAVYVVEPVPGLPRARNAGIRAASGDVVAFTDDDCRPIPSWIQTTARSFAADPALGCVTGPILPLELETPAQEAMEARGGFNRGFLRRRHTLDDGDGPVHPVQAWRFGAGGTMALSRACLDAIGGFDEALWRSEDLDVFYRALRAGYALTFEPGTAVRHRHLARWSDLSRRLFHWGWGYLVFLDKVAREDAPDYAARARLERRNWLRWQLTERLGAALRGRADLPLPLVLREIAGGVVGWHGYPLARRAAERRAARAGAPPAVAPTPVRPRAAA